MPTISMFYGVLVQMFFRDNVQHSTPHLHAAFQGEIGVYSIPDGTLLAGSLPKSKEKLVRAWIEIHKEELIANWSLAVNGEKIFKIKGLE